MKNSTRIHTEGQGDCTGLRASLGLSILQATVHCSAGASSTEQEACYECAVVLPVSICKQSGADLSWYLLACPSLPVPGAQQSKAVVPETFLLRARLRMQAGHRTFSTGCQPLSAKQTLFPVSEACSACWLCFDTVVLTAEDLSEGCCEIFTRSSSLLLSKPWLLSQGETM